MMAHASSTIKSFDDFRETFFQFRLPRVLLTALDLHVFTVMDKKSWTIKGLAKALHVSERGLDVLCRNLASAGLLRKQGLRYHSAKFAQQFLNRHSPYYRGAYLQLMRRQWDDWNYLTQAVRTGNPVESKEPETAEYRQAFSWAMHERSMKSARQVAKQLDLKKATTLLDVGGGPGTYALEFLAQNSKLMATVLDRPAALDVAKEIAKPLKQGQRLSYQAGNFLSDPIHGTYDVIWISNVIHIFSPATNKKLFRRLRSHVNPGGHILIQDTFLQDNDGVRPVEANLFAVTMLLFTESGNTYSQSHVREWLQKTGYKKTGIITLQKGTGDWEGVIIQAMVS